MKIARLRWREKIRWGVVEGERIFALEGDVYGEFRKGGELCPAQEIRLLAPAEPTIMVACAVNYVDAQTATGATNRVVRQEPKLFFKPPTSLMNLLDGVRFPAVAEDPHCEGELCAVIKRRARNVSEEEALDYVLGFTCGNELGAMDLVRKDGNVTRARGFDTSGPLGPYLVTGIDPGHLSIQTRVNGKIKQDSDTSQMIFNVRKLIMHTTAFMTLQPGDVVWTGTPRGRSPVKVGDVMEVEIENIGVLKNEVLDPR